MTEWVSWALIGAAIGAALLWAGKLRAKRYGPKAGLYEARWWAMGLVGAALIYVAFAIVNGANAKWIGIEFAGLAGYGFVAVLGFKKWPLLVGPGWLAHALWDNVLHEGGHTAFVPGWYPPVCLGFDVLVGIVLIATIRYKPQNLPAFLAGAESKR